MFIPTMNTLEENFKGIPKEDNWDGEGSLGCKKEILCIALESVPRLIDIIKNQRGITIGNPFQVMSDLEGGIDLHWKSDEYEMIANVQKGGLVTYFFTKIPYTTTNPNNLSGYLL